MKLKFEQNKLQSVQTSTPLEDRSRALGQQQWRAPGMNAIELMRASLSYKVVNRLPVTTDRQAFGKGWLDTVPISKEAIQ